MHFFLGLFLFVPFIWKVIFPTAKSDKAVWSARKLETLPMCITTMLFAIEVTAQAWTCLPVERR